MQVLQMSSHTIKLAKGVFLFIYNLKEMKQELIMAIFYTIPSQNLDTKPGWMKRLSI